MNRKQLKKLKRSKLKKKQLNISKMPTSVQTKISDGVVKMYHFTNDFVIDSIKKYGLCLGDVISDESKGFNAVNLTEQGHFHDPSAKIKSGLDTTLRITVLMDTSDIKIENMVRYIGRSKKKDWMHSHHKGGLSGHVKYHWFYEGIIAVEDFIAVHRWTGKEFEEVDIHSLKNGETGRYGRGISLPRLQGNFLYDKSGIALEVMKFESRNTSKAHDKMEVDMHQYLDRMHQITFDYGMHDTFRELLWEIFMSGGFDITAEKINQMIEVGLQAVVRISLMEQSVKGREDYKFILEGIRKSSGNSYIEQVINSQKEYLESTANELLSDDFTMSCAKRVA